MAVTARLFQKGRVGIKTDMGESEEDAFRRVMVVVEDSVLDVTCHMNHPERVGLVWSDRV